MSDTVRKVEYFSILVPNRPAQAFSVLSTLVSANVNLLACSGVQRGRRAQIDVVPDSAARFRRAVKRAGLEFVARKSGFLIQGNDRPGALAEHLRKLAERDVNVTGIDALAAGERRWGAIIWVEDEAAATAARVLSAGTRRIKPARAPVSRRAARRAQSGSRRR